MDGMQEFSNLISQVASAITITEANDSDELKSIQKLLTKIKENIDSDGNVTPDLVTQAGRLTLSAQQTIDSIINSSCQDSKASLESVTKSVCELQQLIDGATKAAVPVVSANTVATTELVISSDDAPLVLDFITESKEHVENAEAGLLTLESNSSDTETLNLIFRAFHTIKGMAGFLNLTQIQSLSHSAENLLDKARKGTLVLEGASINAVFASLDMLKKMMAELKDSVEAGKAVRSQGGLESLLEELAGCVEGKKITAAAETASTKQIQNTDASPAKTEEASRSSSTTTTTDEKVKVSLSRLDMLGNMIGELVIAQSMVGQQVLTAFTPEHDLCRTISHQEKIVRELQELSMSLRMVPIHGLFQKMARLVRDLSQKAKKEIQFDTNGEETEIDRNIVDLLADPLVHMIRNSVDHGIESAEDRIKAGKSGTGKVMLKAYHKGGNIVVEVGDDGKGLNKDKILKKAREAGIVGETQELGDQEIFKLIFHAGLSTADKVTDISGRGVGMDVVRKNIEALRGKIEITSEAGVGTTFTIKLPLTLAIIDGQLVRVGKQTYIIPILSIEHSIRPKKEQISTLHNRGEIVNIRGELLPVVRLNKLFGVNGAVEDITNASLVVVEGDSRKCGLMVDELLGQQQVVIKSLGEGVGTLKGVSGGAIMGDGSISLILDAAGIMQLAWNKK